MRNLITFCLFSLVLFGFSGCLEKKKKDEEVTVVDVPSEADNQGTDEPVVEVPPVEVDPAPTPEPVPEVTAPLTYVFTNPVLPPFNIIGDHDTRFRTIEFSTNADTIECSHDGGSSFADCESSTTATYSVLDYISGAELVVRLTRGEETYSHSFHPQTELPGLIILLCDHVVDSDMNAADFVGLLPGGTSGDHNTVCIDSGVSVNSAGDTLNISDSWVDIVGSADLNATLNSISQISDDSTSINNYINLKLGVSNGEYAAQLKGATDMGLLRVDAQVSASRATLYSPATYPDDPTLFVAESVISNTLGQAIHLNHNGWHRGSVVVTDSTIKTTGGFDAAIHLGGSNSSGSVVVTGSTVTTNNIFGEAIFAWSPAINVINSTLHSDNNYTISSYNTGVGANIMVSGSTLSSNKSGVVDVTGNSTLTVTSSVLKKTTGDGQFSSALFRLDDDGDTVTVNDGGGNSVCTENSGISNFTSFTSGDATVAGNFVSPLPVSECP